MQKNEILKEFEIFSGNTGGIETWLQASAPDEVFETLGQLNKHPLTRATLNQLLLLSHEAGMSEGFFKYYWEFVPEPNDHPYDARKVPGFSDTVNKPGFITSIAHLKWGLYRFYMDCLLYFGNTRHAYRYLRTLSFSEIAETFQTHCYDYEKLKLRGKPLPLSIIPKDDRYLISEMACKSFEPKDGVSTDMLDHLKKQLAAAQAQGHSRIKVKDLINGTWTQNNADRQYEFGFSASEFEELEVGSQEELASKYDHYKGKFDKARSMALRNTSLYLSAINDLDVYVATSMRSRADFRSMAEKCEVIFTSDEIDDLDLRYFDPTLSAAPGHEDKGLIECLMVKSAKVLIYIAGEKESYGKDAEAAMALSLGKPVIFLCDDKAKSRFYREVHPLSRLIHFDTGVAVGAIVTDDIKHVPILLKRIFSNSMEYEIHKPKPNYFELKEKVTNSVVRIQTDDTLLKEVFWDHYHNRV